METSRRASLSPPRRRILLLGGGAALIAMLVAGGRISGDSIIAWASIVISALIAGQAASLVARVQVGPSQAGLVPGAIERIDPLGTLIIPAILVLGGIGFFGWLKPLPETPASPRGRNAFVLRALVVPAASLVMVAAADVAFRSFAGGIGPDGVSFPVRVAFLFGYANLWMLVINLLPIPPLAGSVLLERVLPLSAWARYARIRPFLLPGALGLVLLCFLLNIGLTSGVASILAGWWNALLGI